MSHIMSLMDTYMPARTAGISAPMLPAVSGGSYAAAPSAALGNIGYSASYVISYNGEKNGGEAGPIVKYTIDHYALRDRSWQLLLESEVCSIVYNKYCIWTVGPGLRLQALPQKKVLESEGIVMRGGMKEATADNIEEDDWTEDFNELTEARWKLYSDDAMSDWTNMRSLNWLEYRAHLESIVGGDVLVVMRLVKGVVKVQLIDGGRVRTPLSAGGTRLSILGEGIDVINPNTGNRIVHGVEIDDKGEHVAYWVQSRSTNTIISGINDFTRILARGSRSGALMAFMVYGNEYRLDNTRGIPLIAAVIETAKVMERYKSASIGAAEELAKVPYFIEHGPTSSGRDPQIKAYAQQMAGFVTGEALEIAKANQTVEFQNVLATMGKQIFNMPVDSKISVPDRNLELAFKEFYDTNFNYFAATLMVPPEVALSMYNSNYSASRAATKDWEHTLEVKRSWFSSQFKQRIYNFWLDNEVLRNRIIAPGYTEALLNENVMALKAYRFARWRGEAVPSIDPKKEAEYWRLLLGDNGASIPMGTVEEATEALTGGDSESNIKQFAKEKKKAEALGLKPIPKNGNPAQQGNNKGGDAPADAPDDNEGEQPANTPTKK